MPKRRQQGEGAVFQRKSDGMWVGRIELGHGPGGKRRRKTVYARTQAGAIGKLREARKAVDAGNYQTAGTTLEKWMQHWLSEVCPAKPRMKPKTLRTYKTYVDEYLVPTIGKIRLDKLTLQHVRNVRNVIDEKGLSTTTARNAHRILGTALADAEREGLVTRNVTRLVPAPPQAPATRRPMSLVEARALFASVENERLASRWQAAMCLGARQGELLGLQWSHVDLDAGVVDLAWQLQRVPYRHGCLAPLDGKPTCGRKRADFCPQRRLNTTPGLDYRVLDGNLCLQRPKTTGSTRMVAMPEPLVESLRRRHADYLAERDAYTVDHGLVWARPDGRPIDGRIDYREWQAHLKKAGIPPLPLHSARHTTATVLQALGTPEHVIMSILGHSEAVTTRRYAHVDIALQRQAMREIGGALTGE